MLHPHSGIGLTAVVSFLVSLVSSLLVFWSQSNRLKREFRTEFAAEAAARRLLSSPKWEKRSFDSIKGKIAGFADDELRKILVGAGAVKFTKDDGTEMWGLLSRNEVE
jgi:hypothetical protein